MNLNLNVTLHLIKIEENHCAMLRLSVTLLLTYNGISRFLFNTHNVLASTLHFTIRILRILLDLVTTFASPFAQLLKKKKKIQTSKEHSHDHDRFFV